MTENEAKQHWCPMVRCSNTGDGADNRAIDKGKVYGTNTPWDHCIASDCMMWRWVRVTDTTMFEADGNTPIQRCTYQGYCGFGGPL